MLVAKNCQKLMQFLPGRKRKRLPKKEAPFQETEINKNNPPYQFLYLKCKLHFPPHQQAKHKSNHGPHTNSHSAKQLSLKKKKFNG